MKQQSPTTTARALMLAEKSFFAINESTHICKIRFYTVGIPQTQETRRAWREVIIATPGLNESVTGIILFEETIHRITSDGMLFGRGVSNLRDIDALVAAKVLPNSAHIFVFSLLRLSVFSAELRPLRCKVSRF